MTSEVRTPRLVANEDRALLVRWLAEHRSRVEAGQVIAELETSKSVVEVTAPCRGFLVQVAPAGTTLGVGDVLARVHDEAPRGQTLMHVQAPPAQPPRVRSTPGARRLAEALGVDLTGVPRRAVVRERDVLAHLEAAQAADRPRSPAPASPSDGADCWEIADAPGAPGGQALFSAGFLLRLLSHSHGAAPPPWRVRFAVVAVRSGAAVARVLVAALAHLPLVGALTEMLVRAWPRGLPGLVVRAAYFRRRLATLGTDTMIDPFVEVWGGRNVHVAHGCHLDRHASLAADPTPASQGRLELGPYVHVGPYVQLFGQGGLRVGALVALGAGTKIYSIANVGEDPGRPARLLSHSHAAPIDLQRQARSAVEIGEYAFLGLDVCVLPGVRIGRGAFVGSGTVVATDVPDFAVFGGSPPRVLGYRTPRPPDGGTMEDGGPACNSGSPGA